MANLIIYWLICLVLFNAFCYRLCFSLTREGLISRDFEYVLHISGLAIVFATPELFVIWWFGFRKYIIGEIFFPGVVLVTVTIIVAALSSFYGVYYAEKYREKNKIED